jgi:hypothetical protein
MGCGKVPQWHIPLLVGIPLELLIGESVDDTLVQLDRAIRPIGVEQIAMYAHGGRGGFKRKQAAL